MTEFAADTYQNEFLARGATHVDALVTVAASGADDVVAGPAAAEIVIVDVSGSMKFPRTKIKAAIVATCAAIDCIRDGVRFAVIAGADDARQVYPFAGLETASARHARPGQGRGPQAQGRRRHRHRPLAHRGQRAARRRTPRRSATRSSSPTARTRTRPRRSSRRRSTCARDASSATAGASAPTGRWRSCAPSRRSSSAPSRRSASPRTWPPTSPRPWNGRWAGAPATCRCGSGRRSTPGSR